MELREVVVKIFIRPARGRSLLETEKTLRDKIAALPFVQELEVMSSRPEEE